MMMITGALNGPDYYNFSSKQSFKPIIYTWSPDSLKNSLPENTRPHLKVSYYGKKGGDCKIAFRLFAVKRGEAPSYLVNSKQYMGSYSLGQSCDETFIIPLDEKLSEMKTGPLFFHIIPIDMKGLVIDHDLKSNFKISVEFK